MRHHLALLALTLTASSALALPRIPRPGELDRLNKGLKGRVVDFTSNHGKDRRFYSQALGEKRDMYVYLPPCYDPAKQYPLLIWLHGFSQDEKNTKSIATKFDEETVAGRIPPMVIAIPDGTFRGWPSMTNSGSFYLNGKKGRYEDYLVQDVWNVLFCNFSLRPEREAHAIAGASMGGTSAFNIAFKHKDKFGVVIGIMPLLDLLYEDCHGNHFGDFDPNCLGRMQKYRPMSSAGRIWGINIRFGAAMRPVFGGRKNVEARLPLENPVEMLELYDVQPSDFSMFIAYGKRDQFNGDAENESFLYHANRRGVTAEVAIHPTGKHSRKTGMSFFPEFGRWITPVIGPYAP